MLEITDYKILTENNYYSLAIIVKSYLKDGWQPLGGVSSCLHATSNSYESGKDFYQAMVKYKQPQANQL